MKAKKCKVMESRDLLFGEDSFLLVDGTVCVSVQVP